jgi:hypothetical protein
MTSADLYIQGKVTGDQQTGGHAGRMAGGTTTLSNLEINIEVVPNGATPNYMGGVIGYISAVTMSNLSVRGTVKGQTYVGGIIGYSAAASASLTNSTSAVDVTMTATPAGSYIGGVVGYQVFPMSQITASGNVTAVGSSYVGGMSGTVSVSPGVTVSDLTYTGTVHGDTYVGGIAGQIQWSNILRSVNKGKVIGDTSGAGGVVGWANCVALAQQVANEGIVDGTAQVGGIFGYHYYYSSGGNCTSGAPFITEQAYNTGEVHGVTNVGGIDGYMGCYINTGIFKLQDSYSTGPVTGNGSAVGGIIGRLIYGGTANSGCATTLQRLYAGSQNLGVASDAKGAVSYFDTITLPPTVASVFWDTQVSGLSSGFANISGTGYTGAAITGQTTAAMQNSAGGNIYSINGWDFTNVWKWPAGTGYPKLKWQP